MTKYQKLLAVDYGQRNIGLALSSSLIPEPLPPLKVSNFSDALTKISAIIAVTAPDIVIVGIPEGPLEEEVNSLIQALELETSTPILAHPETLTTQEALAKLREQKASRAKTNSEHSFAACLILEDYLESTITPTSPADK